MHEGASGPPADPLGVGAGQHPLARAASVQFPSYHTLLRYSLGTLDASSDRLQVALSSDLGLPSPSPADKASSRKWHSLWGFRASAARGMFSARSL